MKDKNTKVLPKNSNTMIEFKKCKISKTLNSEEYSKRKVPNQMAKIKDNIQQTNEHNCHIPELVQAF